MAFDLRRTRPQWEKAKPPRRQHRHPYLVAPPEVNEKGQAQSLTGWQKQCQVMSANSGREYDKVAQAINKAGTHQT
jgi:hypothetical protein